MVLMCSMQCLCLHCFVFVCHVLSILHVSSLAQLLSSSVNSASFSSMAEDSMQVGSSVVIEDGDLQKFPGMDPKPPQVVPKYITHW